LRKEINTDALRKRYFEMLNKQKFVIEETLPTRNIPDDFKISEKKMIENQSLKRIDRV